MEERIRWHCYEDAQAVARATAARVVEAADTAVKERASFRLVLAGGTTPRLVYEMLASMNTDFSRWQLFLGDERCLDADDAERNSVMIQKSLLDSSTLQAGQVHWIPAERGNEQAALDYERLIQPLLPFDMVLLGMGEDGHTASLFPGQTYESGRLVVPVYNAPKPPANRVSLSFEALAQSRAMLVLVTGESKRAAVQGWKQAQDLPVARLSSLSGVDVMLDEKAASGTAGGD